MPSMRWFYAAFWIILAVLLVWQFTSYNHHLDQVVADAGPQQQHFFFNPNSTNTATGEPVTASKPDGADVQQVGFTYDQNAPSQGFITCHVTLKNQGNWKATHVQIQVRPYRGAGVGDPDENGGRSNYHLLSDSDPAAQLSQTLSFPDLDPGQSATRDVSFYGNPLYTPNGNPNPAIAFLSEPPRPPTPAPAPAHP